MGFFDITPEKIKKWKKKKKLKKILNVFNLEDQNLIISACNSLALVGDADCVEPLYKIMLKYMKTTPQVFQAAEMAIIKISDPAAFEKHLPYLKNDFWVIRNTAVFALRNFQIPAAYDALLNLLDDPHKNIKNSIIHYIPNMKKLSVEQLLRHYKVSEYAIESAFRSFILAQGDSSLNYILNSFSNFNLETRIFVLKFLPEFKDERVFPFVTEQLNSNIAELEHIAIKILIEYKPLNTASLLYEYFKEKIHLKKFLKVTPINMVPSSEQYMNLLHDEAKKETEYKWDSIIAEKIINFFNEQAATLELEKFKKLLMEKQSAAK